MTLPPPETLGFLLLASLLLLWLGYVIRLVVVSPYTPWECVLYGICYLLCRGLWRLEIERPLTDEVLGSGGAVVVSNHRSSIDPLLLQIPVGRRVHWMVAGEYHRHVVFGPILYLLQTIPTSRGGIDTAATRYALRLTQQGRWIGMFPEGRINRTAQPLLSVRPGAALVAIRTGVPLIPCWIEGAPTGPEVYSPLTTPARVRIRYGKPIWPPTDLPRGEELKRARGMILEVMQQVVQLSGRSQPSIQLAGRGWVNDSL